MTVELINGSELSNNLRETLKENAQKLKDQGVTPHLTVILVGNNPASEFYVKQKKDPL